MKEIAFFGDKGSFDNMVKVFGELGCNKGVLCMRNSVVCDYKNIEFALVEVPGHSYFYEAETMVGESDNIGIIHNDMAKVINDLRLSIFGDEEYFSYVKTLNLEANEVFDYSAYRDNYFKKWFGI